MLTIGNREHNLCDWFHQRNRHKREKWLELKVHFQPWCNAVVCFCFEPRFCLNSASNWSVIFYLISSQNTFCVFSDEFEELVNIILFKTVLEVLIRNGIRWIYWFSRFRGSKCLWIGCCSRGTRKSLRAFQRRWKCWSTTFSFIHQFFFKLKFAVLAK